MILAAILLAAAPADLPVVSAVEPRPPQRQVLRFEAKCGEQSLALNGVGLGSPGAEMLLNGKPADLPTGAKAFLSEGRAAYRVYAVCPPTAPAFQLRLYRASASASGGVAYAHYALDVAEDGKVEDRGGAMIDADAFWYR